MQIPDLNPKSITDPVTRQIVIQLLDMIETLPAKYVTLRVENQDLRDDVWHGRRDSRGSLISNYPRCRLHRLPIIPRKRSAARARPAVNPRRTRP